MASLVGNCVRANLRLLNQGYLQRLKFATRNVTTASPILNKKEYEINFTLPNGEKVKAKGKEGDSLLDVVVNNNLDIDGFGACEGTLTCSTCHVVLKKADFDRLPEKATEEENDMLDLAYGLTET
ncbi:hypothetical protein O3M35_003469 [Rhynocoris fuscipes]|uniref:2Fe-2S ferredoxin-type domain-containing protein n=1 Tax=Rhynocoris fuscipes TaxID=488301 RepID=A0AAW1CJ09_9HEMI